MTTMKATVLYALLYVVVSTGASAAGWLAMRHFGFKKEDKVSNLLIGNSLLGLVLSLAITHRAVAAATAQARSTDDMAAQARRPIVIIVSRDLDGGGWEWQFRNVGRGVAVNTIYWQEPHEPSETASPKALGGLGPDASTKVSEELRLTMNREIKAEIGRRHFVIAEGVDGLWSITINQVIGVRELIHELLAVTPTPSEMAAFKSGDLTQATLKWLDRANVPLKNPVLTATQGPTGT